MTRNMKIAAAALVAVFVLIAYLVFHKSKDDSDEGAADDQNEGSGKGTARTRRNLPHVGDKAAEEAGVPEHVECKMKPCKGPVCDKCVNENCDPVQAGCQGLTDTAERKLCEDLYECFTDPAHDCTLQGDPLKCWCGTNPTTCLTDTKGPTAPNGVCAKLLYQAAKTTDPTKIRERFGDATFALGRAVNLTTCRGGFCGKECSVK